MRSPPPIFFHNQSDDATLRAIRTLGYEPKVQLNDSLVREIGRVLGLADPTEPTVLLLWPKYIKRRAVAHVNAGVRIVAVVVSVLLAVAAAVAHG
jgi:hypothetical protein